MNSTKPVSDKTPITLGLARLIFGSIATGIIASFVMWMDIAKEASARDVVMENVVKRLDTHEMLLREIQSDITDIRVGLAGYSKQEQGGG